MLLFKVVVIVINRIMTIILITPTITIIISISSVCVYSQTLDVCRHVGEDV